MKNVFVSIFTLFFVAVVVGACFAQVEEKQAKLEKILKYVNTLDKKIIAARNARKINKIAELKELKRDALALAKALKAEITEAEAPKPAAKPVAKPAVTPLLAAEPAGKPVVCEPSPISAMVGYGGGAGIVSGIYTIQNQRFDLNINAGIGLGSGYSIVTVGGAIIMPLGENHAGLEVGLANYSESVADIIGAGTVSKGSNMGVGIFGGRNIGAVDARIGYNSALGLIVGAVYKF